MRFTTIGFILFLAAVLFVPAQASADTYVLDQAHTSVGFSVKHLGLSTVSGTFDDFKGTIDWDGKNMASGKIDVTIQAASVDTRIKMRDDDLRTAYFDTAKFPAITFKSKKVIATGADAAQVVGDLTIKGVTKEVTLDVKFEGTVEKDPWGKTRSAFAATGKIKRQDFGVKSSNPLSDSAVGDEVTIVIQTEAIKQ